MKSTPCRVKALFIVFVGLMMLAVSCSHPTISPLGQLRMAVKTNESNLILVRVNTKTTEVFGSAVGNSEALNSVLQALSVNIDWRNILVVWDSAHSPEERQEVL